MVGIEMGKGSFKYSCRDCGATELVHWIRLNRKAKPRCSACGGFLDAHSEGAKDNLTIGKMNVVDYREGRGDLKKAKS